MNETDQNGIPQEPLQPESEAAPNPEITPPQTPPVQETSQAVYSQPTAPGYSQPQQVIASSKSSKKGMMVKIAIGVVIILLIVAGILWFVWYQSPSKAINDGLMSVVGTKSTTFDGTVTSDNSTYTMTTTFKGGTDATQGADEADATILIKMKQGDLSGKSFTVDGSLIAAKDGTLYVRANNLAQIANIFIDSMISSEVSPAQGTGATLTPDEINQAKEFTHSYIDPIVKEFDGQWVKLSSSDTSSSSTQCFQNAITKIQTDNAAQQEVINTFEKDNFVSSKQSLGSKNGSNGYLLAFDQTKATQFSNDLKQTSFGKAMTSCDTSSGSTDSSTSPTDGLDSAHVELWIGQWNHQLTRVVIQSTDKSSGTNVNLDVNLQLGKSTSVTVPKDAKSFNDLGASLGM